MMTSPGAEVDSDSSDDEWVITSLNNKSLAANKQTQQKPAKPKALIKKEFAYLQTNSSSSSLSSITLSTAANYSSSSPLLEMNSPSITSDTVPLQYLSQEKLQEICKNMDANTLVSQLVHVYKSAEIFIKIREIETDSLSLEMRLREHLESCSDPCTFIVDCLEALSIHFSDNAKIRELTPKFRRLLTEVLCKGLSYFLNIPAEERKIDKEPDLISFDDNAIISSSVTKEKEEKEEAKDLISFDDNEFLVVLSDTEEEDYEESSSDDDSIPIITIEPIFNKYTISRTHQDKLIALIETIPSPIVIYYAMDTFKLGQVIAFGCEREEEGVKLIKRLLKYGYYSEATNCIKKLDLFSQFPIPSIATEMFTASQGMMLPTLVINKPSLQRELLDFIDKQLRFNFAGPLEVVPPEKLQGVDTDGVQQLSRLKERKFQKDLVTCGVKIAQEMKISLNEYYFINLSQRYACLRWILAQRALQQMEDQELSIKKSSNYNGLIDLLCENDSALARLAIKELVDMGDTVAPAFFATNYKEESFFCKYNSLPFNERLLSIVKGEQMSRHWTSLGPKRPSNPNKLPYYELPSNARWLFVNSEKSLIFMKDILSQSNVCGIDTEWVPAFATLGNPVKTALMQIASDIGGYIFLLDLKTILSSENKMLYKLVEKILQFLFEDEEILKIAFDFTGDFQLLYQSIPSSKSWNVAKLLDLKSLTSPPKPNAENGQPITGGLAGVVTAYLGCTLNKRQQISNWEKRPLTEEQAIYAESKAIKTYDLDSDETVDITFAIDRLKRIKWENIAFIGFQCWFVAMSFDAAVYQNTAEVISLAVINFVCAIFGALEVIDGKRWLRILTDIKYKHKIPLDITAIQIAYKIEIVLSTCVALFAIGFAYLSYAVVKEFGWKTYKKIGADISIQQAMRPEDHWYIWICFVILGMILALTTSALGFVCMTNFGKGLKPYIQRGENKEKVDIPKKNSIDEPWTIDED
ncbi:hypothetical protein G6F16_005333 [Rhizopus arrhizus]|nr:hypothetical protein G6F16_005333 [Rhizopus arrhizus]KAG1116120.1 hypothetical protein G6F40_003915 [Rhizopus arrhizus]